MGDETTVPSQPAAPAPEGTPAAPSMEAIVKAATDAAVAAAVQAVGEPARRMAQSEVDRHLRPVLAQQKTIQDKLSAFDGQVKLLKDMGMLKDDANVALARQAIVAEAYTAQPEPEPAPAQAQPQMTPAEQEGYLLAAELGLQDGDPELAGIVTDKGFGAWYESIKAAGTAKRARIGGAGPTTPNATTPNPLAVDLLGGGPSRPNQIEKINDPSALLEMGLYEGGKPKAMPLRK